MIQNYVPEVCDTHDYPKRPFMKLFRVKPYFLMLGATYLANNEKLLLSKTQNNLMFLLRYKRAKTAGKGQ